MEKNPINKFHKDILLTFSKMSLTTIEVGIFSLKDQINNQYGKLSFPNSICIFNTRASM